MKRIITLLVICLLLITNLQAQTMSKNGSFHCQYHEEDTTATIFVHFVGGGNTIYDNNLVIPDYVEKEGGDGTKYTVTTWGSGGYSGAIGWQGGSPDRPSHINVYIPKTLKKITSNVFSNHGNRLYAQFNFFFEDEEVYNYLTEWYEIHQNYVWMGRLSHKIGDFELEENWFVDSNGFYIRGIFKWDRLFFEKEENLIIEKSSTETGGWVSVYLKDNVPIKKINCPSWINISGTPFFSNKYEIINITEDFILNYNFSINIGKARSGDIELIDENGKTKIITINQTKGNETSIPNINVSNVNYRIDNGTIYFDEVVNNIQLYDLQGRLLCHNKNTGTLNIGNNLKGVYLLKYDDKATKIIF